MRDATTPNADLVLHASGATLFGAIPDGTAPTATLARLTVGAAVQRERRATRRTGAWSRLGWQPSLQRP